MQSVTCAHVTPSVPPRDTDLRSSPRLILLRPGNKSLVTFGECRVFTIGEGGGSTPSLNEQLEKKQGGGGGRRAHSPLAQPRPAGGRGSAGPSGQSTGKSISWKSSTRSNKRELESFTRLEYYCLLGSATSNGTNSSGHGWKHRLPRCSAPPRSHSKQCHRILSSARRPPPCLAHSHGLTVHPEG